MFGVLDRYIGKTIFNTIMTTLFLLVSLSGIIKFVEQLRKTGKGAYSVWDAGYFTILSVPTDLELFFPMAALLGALLGLGNLAQRSELVVMQAAGFTRLQVAASVMKTAIPLVFLSMAVGEFLAPAGDQLAHNYRSEQIDGSSLLAAQGGLWAKDGKDFIFIQKLQDERHLNGVTVYHFNDQRRLESVRYAASAQWDKHRKEWNLSQIDESDLSNPEQITGSQQVSSVWKTALTPDKLQVVALDPDSLSIRGLHDYIQYLDQTGQKSDIYRLNMWSKIVQPLSVAVMMLMALSFIFGPLRSVSMGQRVVTGISFGFVFYVLDKIFGQLSLVKGLPPVLGAIVPSAVFLALSLVLLIKRK